MGISQKSYFSQDIPRETELICKKGRWYFNLFLDLLDVPLIESSTVFGVDLEENIIAAISNGKMIDGGKVRHERDKFLAKRRSLQSNGSQPAKQLLRKSLVKKRAICSKSTTKGVKKSFKKLLHKMLES